MKHTCDDHEWIGEGECPKCAQAWEALDKQFQSIADKAAKRQPTFEEAWKEFEDAGYRYGEDALFLVKLGFEIAKGRKPK